MYKLLLCWRYLRTRYIALASVISVMLGVATLIVVNSVMEGFSSEMQNRIHGILSDVVISVRNFSGAPNAVAAMEQIRQVAGNDIEAMTPTVQTPAMLQIQFRGQEINKPIRMLVGIDEKTQGKVSDFGQYLQNRDNRVQLDWRLREGGYYARDPEGGDNAPERPQLADAGWKYRREVAAEKLDFRQGFFNKPQTTVPPPELEIKNRGKETDIPHSALNIPHSSDSPHPNPLPKGEGNGVNLFPPSDVNPPPQAAKDKALPSPEASPEWPMIPPDSPLAAKPGSKSATHEDPFKKFPPAKPFDMAKEQHTGIVLGMAMVSYRQLKDPDDPTGGTQDRLLVRPGDDVMIWVPTVGDVPRFIPEKCTVVDLYESKMNEYDETFVFVPISRLQELRGMFGKFNSIQIKLKPGANGDVVRDKLKAVFPPEFFDVETWRDKQGPLLQAVELESRILNILLFFIIAVAGFGILAIFFMIVVEKTRDIGILKSLGASNRGVMSIFLSYGLLLGAVGSGVGLILGLLFVHYINEIANLVARLTGHPVFDPTIYYFSKIPTIIEPLTLAWIVLGAMGIAVASSILPARRAARLHPVEALRYE
jgi:lipoprotein-releasing system permease protein